MILRVDTEKFYSNIHIYTSILAQTPINTHIKKNRTYKSLSGWEAMGVVGGL